MRDELETLIAAWHDAWFTKDAPAIAQMMAQDYVYVGSVTPRTGLRAARTRRGLSSCSVKAPRWCAIGGRAPGLFVARLSSMTIDA